MPLFCGELGKGGACEKRFFDLFVPLSQTLHSCVFHYLVSNMYNYVVLGVLLFLFLAYVVKKLFFRRNSKAITTPFSDADKSKGLDEADCEFISSCINYGDRRKPRD